MTDKLARAVFLADFEHYIAYDPDVVPFLFEYMQRGMTKALDESRTRAADMEAALAFSISRNLKQKDNALIKQKLEQWQNKSALDWRWFFEEQKP